MTKDKEQYKVGDYIEVEQLDGKKVKGRLRKFPDEDAKTIQGFHISSDGADINYKPGQYKNVKKIPFTGEIKRKLIKNEWWVILGYESGDFAVYDVINTHSSGEGGGAASLSDVVAYFNNREEAIKYLDNFETFDV